VKSTRRGTCVLHEPWEGYTRLDQYAPCLFDLTAIAAGGAGKGAMESQESVRDRNQQGRIVGATAGDAQPDSRPKLVFVYRETCGHSRRVEAFLAQVLQRRHNHDTFDVVRVSAEKQPKLVQQLGVAEVPTLLIIDERKIEARVERPRGRIQIQTALGRWLK